MYWYIFNVKVTIIEKHKIHMGREILKIPFIRLFNKNYHCFGSLSLLHRGLPHIAHIHADKCYKVE